MEVAVELATAVVEKLSAPTAETARVAIAMLMVTAVLATPGVLMATAENAAIAT